MAIIFEDDKYAYFLHNVPGIGKKGIHELLGEGRTSKEIYGYNETQLINLIHSKKKVDEFMKKRKEWDLQGEFEKLSKQGIEFFSIENERFPDRLRKIPDPPCGLFVKGKLPCEDIPTVAVIGARRCSEYGSYMARQFAKSFVKEGIQVVSGLAAGIDGITQREVVKQGGKTYAVMGCGVSNCYPRDNYDIYREIPLNGGVISEYLPYMKPVAGFFPERNRIISGLADVILVVEAKEKSGTLITVDLGLEQGKEVYAMPGRVVDEVSKGCHQLISQGAGIVISTEQMVSEVLRIWNDSGRSMREMNQTSIACFDTHFCSAEEEEILRVLSYEGKGVDEILSELERGSTVSQTFDVLVQLILKGKVENKGQRYYLRKD